MVLVAPRRPAVRAAAWMAPRRFAVAISLPVLVGSLLSDPALPPGSDEQPDPIRSPRVLDGSAEDRLPVGPELIREFCSDCHDGPGAEGGLDLVGWASDEAPGDRAEIAREVRSVLVLGAMPPEEDPQPSPDQRRAMLDWLIDLPTSAASAGPGRVTMRRLSRFEYRRSVEDLCFATPATGDLPADTAGYGFDNIGDAASFSVLHLDAFARAADRVLEKALPDPFRRVRRRFEAEECPTDFERGRGADRLNLYSNGRVGDAIEIIHPGTYELRIRLWAQQAGPDLARVRIRFGDLETETAIDAASGKRVVLRLQSGLAAGPQPFGAAFVNDYYAPEHEDPSQRDRNLLIDWFEIEGPFEQPEPTGLQQWIQSVVGPTTPAVDRSAADLYAADPAVAEATRRQQADEILSAFATRAFRRPARPSEVARLVALCEGTVASGESFTTGLRDAMRAVLCSPNFLFRVEPGGLRSLRGDRSASEALDDHALASRLSYFLWSTIPDRALLESAAAGALSDPKALRSITRRMLADPRASAISENFALQWLDLRRLDEFEVDPRVFPDFDPRLIQSMRTETVLALDRIRSERLPLRMLLDQAKTFVDARLADHYGIEFPSWADPDAFVEVDVPEARRGLLGHASILATTSEPTRTSPVRRGRWILDVLLDAAPPPPPPGSDAFEGGEAAVRSPASQREALEAHRARAECAVCHDRLDPFGLALERFDAIGRYRTEVDGRPIEADATLPDGRRLDGIGSVRAAILGEDEFVRALARRLFVFAIGRPATPTDLRSLDTTLDDIDREPTLEDLVLWVTGSEAFRQRSVLTRH